MKLQELKQLIREEIENALGDAAPGSKPNPKITMIGPEINKAFANKGVVTSNGRKELFIKFNKSELGQQDFGPKAQRYIMDKVNTLQSEIPEYSEGEGGFTNSIYSHPYLKSGQVKGVAFKNGDVFLHIWPALANTPAGEKYDPNNKGDFGDYNLINLFIVNK
jgi:hypothetical protein